MKISDMPVIISKKGISDFGITDHLNTYYNLPDIKNSRKDFDMLDNICGMHFGVEVSCVSEWELNELSVKYYEKPVWGIRRGGPACAKPAICLREEDILEFKIEYVVGGTHWPLYVPFERDAIIKDYHRQNMFLAVHPLVDIVAHPWWWMGRWQDPDGKYRREPWFDNFRKIPTSMHDEFASALVESGTAVEINAWACLLNKQYPEDFVSRYVEYLAYHKERNVKFSFGSDTHDATYLVDWEKVEKIIAPLQLAKQNLWDITLSKQNKRHRE